MAKSIRAPILVIFDMGESFRFNITPNARQAALFLMGAQGASPRPDLAGSHMANWSAEYGIEPGTTADFLSYPAEGGFKPGWYWCYTADENGKRISDFSKRVYVVDPNANLRPNNIPD